MTNPINSLGIKLQYYQRGLAEVQGKLFSLKEEHRKLAKDAVETEKTLDEFKESVSKMCNGCQQIQSVACMECPLNKVAIKYDLWG